MLYVTATPLGNLEDTSERVKETFKKCDLVIAENPTHSKIILDHFDLGKKRFIQFAEYNEGSILPKIISELKKTDAILVSDAGTPGISDPGFRIVRAAIAEGIDVSPIPGPSAAISALSVSGLPTDKFIFFGFLPKTEIKLIKLLEEAKDIGATAVFYESPQRILKTLDYIVRHFPEAKMVIAREMTKLHEEFTRGSAEEVKKIFSTKTSIKGEITVVISFK
jgi:16S rRNA (cytidine1402-2'-O)-methyltransferase